MFDLRCGAGSGSLHVTPIEQQEIAPSAVHHYQQSLRKAGTERGGNYVDTIGAVCSACDQLHYVAVVVGPARLALALVNMIVAVAGPLIGADDESCTIGLSVDSDAFAIALIPVSSENRELRIGIGAVGIGMILADTVVLVGVVHIAQSVVHCYGLDLSGAAEPSELPYLSSSYSAATVIGQPVLPDVGAVGPRFSTDHGKDRAVGGALVQADTHRFAGLARLSHEHVGLTGHVGERARIHLYGEHTKATPTPLRCHGDVTCRST